MKLKDLKNDGVFEKKEKEYLTVCDRDNRRIAQAYYEGEHQAKAELSEAELVVDENRIYEIISLSCTSQLKLLEHKEVDVAINDMKQLAKAISSSMSEWLRLERGEQWKK